MKFEFCGNYKNHYSNFRMLLLLLLLMVTSIFGFIPSLTSYRIYIHDKPFTPADAINICKCKYLTDLSITNSSIKLLTSHFLTNCHRLDVLLLSNNGIMEITHDTFNDLPQLFKLDLSKNHITTLPKDVFKPLTGLRILKLDENRIETIDSHLFFHNQHLVYLDINENNLKTIEPKSFRKLESLLFLSIHSNPNLNNSDFLYDDKFIEINMANCAFTQLFIPMNARMINAQTNQINNITAHPNTKLRSLWISRNNFTNLLKLSPLADLSDLHIEYNGIDHFNFTHLSNMKNLTNLSIEMHSKQMINIPEITKSLPSLRWLNVVSSDSNEQNPIQILKDSKQQQQFSIRINGKEMHFEESFDRVNQRDDKIPSQMIKCLGKI